MCISDLILGFIQITYDKLYTELNLDMCKFYSTEINVFKFNFFKINEKWREDLWIEDSRHNHSN